jgi:hypothetical protein
MSGFVKAYVAPAPRSKASGFAAIIYAAVLTIFAVTQLFTFEDFIKVFQASFSPLGIGFGVVLAAMVVIAEVFALPALLRMPLSIAFRWVSIGLTIVVPLLWLSISFWSVTQKGIETVGFLGALVSPEPGAWAIAFSFALLFLAGWAVYGILPPRNHNIKRTAK